MAGLRNTSVTVTVEGIYGETAEALRAHLQRNQEFTDFCPPTRGVKFLALDGRVRDYNPESKYGGPRLIVGTKTLKKFVFVETGTEGRPVAGQPYISNPQEVEAGQQPAIAFGRTGATYATAYPLLTFSSAEHVAE